MLGYDQLFRVCTQFSVTLHFLVLFFFLLSLIIFCFCSINFLTKQSIWTPSSPALGIPFPTLPYFPKLSLIFLKFPNQTGCLDPRLHGTLVHCSSVFPIFPTFLYFFFFPNFSLFFSQFSNPTCYLDLLLPEYFIYLDPLFLLLSLFFLIFPMSPHQTAFGITFITLPYFPNFPYFS